jgi:hypothetical protein
LQQQTDYDRKITDRKIQPVQPLENLPVKNLPVIPLPVRRVAGAGQRRSGLQTPHTGPTINERARARFSGGRADGRYTV